jgi:nicotinamide-nucleotide amidase
MAKVWQLEMLKAGHATLSTAESCTGGLIGKKITDYAGASQAYLGGFIVYSDAMKSRLLGIPLQYIKKYGAVSREVAVVMALNAIKKTGSSYAVASTGYADGAEHGKVWLAAASAACVVSRLFFFKGSRENVREEASEEAMQLLLEVTG